MKIGFSKGAHGVALQERCARLSAAIRMSQDGAAIADMESRLEEAQESLMKFNKSLMEDLK